MKLRMTVSYFDQYLKREQVTASHNEDCYH